MTVIRWITHILYLLNLGKPKHYKINKVKFYEFSRMQNPASKESYIKH